MSVSTTQVGLNLFAKLTDSALGNKDKSLIAATKGARFEPVVLVDSDVTTYEGITDVMHSIQSLFTGYLLQAISLYGNVGGTKVIKELNRFQPDRDGSMGGFVKSLMSTESYKSRLPTPNGSLALESFDTNTKRYSKAYKTAVEENALNVAAGDKDIESGIHQAASLSIGKVYNIDFTSNGQTIKVPITIRLIAMIVASERLSHILTVDTTKLTDLKDRWYAWRSGRISFISDLLFARDLIKQHRKEIMDDKDGVYSNILRKRVSNNLAAISSGAPSLNSASNIAVISSDTAKAIETKLNTKLSNFTQRNKWFFEGDNARKKIMDNNGLMLLVIIDKFADQITIYSEGIAESTQLSLRQIKNAASGSKGPDISEILKAYQLGMSPSTL